jgi:hypothetical protein
MKKGYPKSIPFNFKQISTFQQQTFLFSNDYYIPLSQRNSFSIPNYLAVLV